MALPTAGGSQMPPFEIPGSTHKRVAFRTIGCKLNQCETAQMQETLRMAGYDLVGWAERADVRVLNTCTVTAKSDRTCRREIRLARRLDPGCLVAVTGCYAQVDPEVVAAIPGVDLVLGNMEKLRLTDFLDKLLTDAAAPEDDLTPAAATDGDFAPAAVPARGSAGEVSPTLKSPSGTCPGTVAAHQASHARHQGDRVVDARLGPPLTAVSAYPAHPDFDREFITHFYGYTRAFLKIQTGCDSHCSYCVIPLARGPARSMPRGEVVDQMRLLAGQGFREVVLTGINLGSWGRDTGEARLPDLLDDLVRAGGVPRYRLSSIEPLEVDRELLDAVGNAGGRVAHHFHLPLQSGSDSVLTRMNRPYLSLEYGLVLNELRRRFPDAAIGADVIVGFPGETEDEFMETYELVERLPLTYLHVFGYSDRPGTAASKMRSKVHPETIQARSAKLRDLGACKLKAFQERFLGRELRALVLRERAGEGRFAGLTGNYIEVEVSGDDSLINRFVNVRIEGPGEAGRWKATVQQVEAVA